METSNQTHIFQEKMNRHQNREESGGWQTVMYRRQRKKEKVLEGETTFFVANLPNGCTSALLWEIFRGFGTMVDAYIPARKDRGGNTYAFIRFTKVIDKGIMEEKLNTVKIDGTKIAVNVAKYEKEQRRGKFQSGIPNRFHIPVNLDPLASPSHRKSITLPAEEAKHCSDWQNKALLGETSNMKKLENLVVGLKAEGFEDISIKYMGGLRQGHLEYWFATLELWCGQIIGYQRVAWVKIEGMGKLMF
ncbi:hypothetical protein LXL04_004681 [Taraxacum kok-saghyz]